MKAISNAKTNLCRIIINEANRFKNLMRVIWKTKNSVTLWTSNIRKTNGKTGSVTRCFSFCFIGTGGKRGSNESIF